jgi:tripartite-type tricarboxylate transporter receptor subunit TctC
MLKICCQPGALASARGGRYPHAKAPPRTARPSDWRAKLEDFMDAWRSGRRHLLVSVLAILAAVAPAAAQDKTDDYPNRPIRVIAPAPPGGMIDIVSRVFAQKVGERTKQTVVVENRSGGNSAIGADLVAKAKPDGYTLLMGFHGTNAVLPHLDPKLPFDPAKDFAPVALLAVGPSVLLVHPSVPATSVKELVALAKAKPGALSYASFGNGTSAHLMAEQFKLHAGVDILHVPYRGAAPATQDVVAGQVPMMFDVIGTAVSYIKDGRLRALAVTSATRSPVFPDLPTIAESGYPQFESGAWFGLFAPTGTPAPIVAWLNREANLAFSEPDVRQRFELQGMTLPLGTPEALGAFAAADSRRWGDVVRRAGIKLE